MVTEACKKKSRYSKWLVANLQRGFATDKITLVKRPNHKSLF
jgi:hypothetical protein